MRPVAASRAPRQVTSSPAGATCRPGFIRSSPHRCRSTWRGCCIGFVCATFARLVRRSSPVPGTRAGITLTSSRSRRVATGRPARCTARPLACHRARHSTPGIQRHPGRGAVGPPHARLDRTGREPRPRRTVGDRQEPLRRGDRTCRDRPRPTRQLVHPRDADGDDRPIQDRCLDQQGR
jgi:hypothetical protein